MQFTAAQIADLVHGKVEGNPDQHIATIAKIEEAGPDSLCFIANPKYEHFLYESRAGIVIINEGLTLQQPVASTLIRVPDAYAAFAQLMEQYQAMVSAQEKSGIEQLSFLHESARTGSNVYIGAFAYVGADAEIGDNAAIYPQVYIGDKVKIGEGSIIHPGAKIYQGCIIGKNVIVHSGAVIGADGFGFAPQADGSFKKVPQLGNVILEDNVEIGANTTIDRATMGSTIIRKNVKLDNLIQIAHNVVIDENTAIAAQTGVSGSTKIGRNCMIGGQAAFVGHIQIADGARINARSGVSKTISRKNTMLNGSPAFEYKNSLKSQAIFRNLPDLAERIKELENKIAALGRTE
jgi:UDP-3-O-[3-hydroxymyristoyl] glucosamine N-acyltransferase